MIALPPRGQLAGFRDPYIFARGVGGRPWKMLLGSGVPGRGGTLLVYHAPTLTSGAYTVVDSLTLNVRAAVDMLLLDQPHAFSASLASLPGYTGQAHRHSIPAGSVSARAREAGDYCKIRRAMRCLHKRAAL